MSRISLEMVPFVNTDIAIVFLTEGGSEMGFGHIARCISLYDAFCCKDITPEFIIQGDDTVEYLLSDKPHTFIDWIDQPDKLLPILCGFDVVFMDSISADAVTCNVIGKLVRLPVYLDDFNYYTYERGLTIDWTIFAEEIHHTKNTFNLLGARYTALRKEFWDAPEKDILMEVGSIMLTMGGSDIRNLTPRILERLRKEYPELRINIIIGKGFSFIDQIVMLADKRMNIVYFPDAAQMKQVMEVSDMAISAGGQTLYELARMGVPTIAVSIIDNQQFDIDGLQKAGFVEYAGGWEDARLEDAIVCSCRALAARKERLKRSMIGRSVVDGLGVCRIVDRITEIYHHANL